MLPELAGPVWGGVLAMFYTEKQGATCAEIAGKFGLKPSQVIGRCVQLAKRVHQETNCPLVEGGDGNTYWPILFFGRSVPSSDREKGKGVFSWKLRPELYDALTEFDILRFLPEKEGSVNVRPEFNLTTEEAVNYIKASETILYLQSLRHIMDDLAATGKQINCICSLLQYLFEVTKSHNKTIRCGAFICMICIIKVAPMYTDVILDVISRAMDSETYEIKVAILTRVMKMNQENPKVAYIIAKGKADNHYYVRKIANE